jgi:hypothetical protein
VSKYLEICSQLGIEPNPNQMPIDPSVDFSYQVQQAFFLYSSLSDKIDSMGGIWLGKDLSGVLDLMTIYNINNKKEVMDYLLYMIQTARGAYAALREQQSKMRSNK